MNMENDVDLCIQNHHFYSGSSFTMFDLCRRSIEIEEWVRTEQTMSRGTVYSLIPCQIASDILTY
jgi:hypothetical protein